MYVADAHCDFLYYMLHREYDVAVPRAGQAVDIPGMRAGGAAMQLLPHGWILMRMLRFCSNA